MAAVHLVNTLIDCGTERAQSATTWRARQSQSGTGRTVYMGCGTISKMPSNVRSCLARKNMSPQNHAKAPTTPCDNFLLHLCVPVASVRRASAVLGERRHVAKQRAVRRRRTMKR